MRKIKESQVGTSTIIALSLIPLSGFAMDVFIPSLPDMAVQLQTTHDPRHLWQYDQNAGFQRGVDHPRIALCYGIVIRNGRAISH